MCKNADHPCPGCKRHMVDEAQWRFFTEEERRMIGPRAAPPPLFQAATVATICFQNAKSAGLTADTRA